MGDLASAAERDGAEGKADDANQTRHAYTRERRHKLRRGHAAPVTRPPGHGGAGRPCSRPRPRPRADSWAGSHTAQAGSGAMWLGPPTAGSAVDWRRHGAGLEPASVSGLQEGQGASSARLPWRCCPSRLLPGCELGRAEHRRGHVESSSLPCSLSHSLARHHSAHSSYSFPSSADGLHCTQSKAGKTCALPPAAITSQSR